MKKPCSQRALPKNTGNAFQATKQKLASLAVSFHARISYIVDRIFEINGSYYDYWMFSDGTNDPSAKPEFFFLNTKCARIYFTTTPKPKHSKIKFIDKFGGSYDLSCEFPLRWLYESFEAELKAGHIPRNREAVSTKKASK